MVKTTIFRIFNTYGPGEDLNYLKKGMVSIYSYYVWKNKPIIVKGSLERVRDLNYIDDVIKILEGSISNKKLKKNEIFNLSSAQCYKVKNLINEILKVNGLKNYKIFQKKGTPGDSFIFQTSNIKLKKFYKSINFTSLNNGLKKYFDWINSIPRNKSNLKRYHPLAKKIYEKY